MWVCTDLHLCLHGCHIYVQVVLLLAMPSEEHVGTAAMKFVTLSLHDELSLVRDTHTHTHTHTHTR